jgi:segregation and condensation protein B
MAMEELEPQTAVEAPEPADPALAAEAAAPEAMEASPETGETAESVAAEADDAPAEVFESEENGGEAMSADDLLGSTEQPAADQASEDTRLKAVLEAIVYVTEEPLTLAQIAAAMQQPAERIRKLLDELVAIFDKPEHGVTVKEVAGGYKMATKAEHHDAVRNFVKSLKPPLKLSLPALETLAVIAYKQPVTGPEIMEIRGVQGGGVLKTLLDRKLIAGAGRKNVIGKPMLYKTTKEFLLQFGLKDLTELPSLKEFEEIRRMAIADEPQAQAAPGEEPAASADAAAETPADMEATAAANTEQPPAETTETSDQIPADAEANAPADATPAVEVVHSEPASAEAVDSGPAHVESAADAPAAEPADVAPGSGQDQEA